MKKIIILTSILLFLITISVVSAENNVSNGFLNDGEVELSPLIENPDYEIDSINDDDKTFDDLQNTIDSFKENSTIYINGTFFGNKTPITINKSITIEGNNTTLNARYLSEIFKINAHNVVLKNIKFVNGIGNSIFWHGNDGKIINCIFEENYPEVICYEGNNGKIINSIFTKNNIRVDKLIGGVTVSKVELKGNNCLVFNSSFEENSFGSILYLIGDNARVINTTFENNEMMLPYLYDWNSHCYAGGILCEGNKLFVNNCTFNNNFRNSEIYLQGNDAKIVDIIFSNNYNNVIYLNGSNNYISNFSSYNTSISSNYHTHGENGIFWYGDSGIINNSNFDNTFIEWKGVNGIIKSTIVHLENNTVLIIDDFKGIYNNERNIWNFEDVIVNPEKLDITINKKDQTYGKKNIITVNAFKNNKKVSNTTIILKITNKIFKKSTNNQGIAKFVFDGLDVNKYNIEIYAFDKKISKNMILKISKAKTTTKIMVKNKKIIITIKSSKKPLKHLKIKVKIFTGKKYKNYNFKTDKKGQIIIKNLKKGKHKIQITTSNKNYKLNTKTKIRV